MVRFGLLLATVRQFAAELRAQPVGRHHRRLRARVALGQTGDQETAAGLQQQFFADSLCAMVRDRMADFMAKDRGQAGLILCDRQDAGVNADLAAGQTKRVGLLALEHHELPSRVGQRRDRGDAPADLPD